MRAAVAGRPVGHSLSPLLHRAAYRALGLDWHYERRDCGTGELAGLVAELRAAPADWAGLSLTMPLKESTVPLLDRVATPLGAVNTVVVDRDGALTGHNTDVEGILAGLDELLGGGRPPTVAVLGAGGTARAALGALARRGGAALLFARDPERAAALVRLGERLGVPVTVHRFGEPLPPVPVIAAVPPGADDDLRPAGPVLDVRYEPWPTRLAAAAARDGQPVVGGRRVLLAQAARQVELMTGRPAPVEAMAEAMGGALGPSSSIPATRPMPPE